jgi:hypothetical protein
MACRRSMSPGAGVHHDGGGLYLQVRATKDDPQRVMRSWLFRYKNRTGWVSDLGVSNPRTRRRPLSSSRARARRRRNFASRQTMASTPLMLAARNAWPRIRRLRRGRRRSSNASRATSPIGSLAGHCDARVGGLLLAPVSTRKGSRLFKEACQGGYATGIVTLR